MNTKIYQKEIIVGKVMSVRGPDKLRERLDRMAERQGFSRNALILKILWEYTDKEKIKEEVENLNNATSNQQLMGRGAEIWRRE